MARIRTIKPDFFTSEDVVRLSPLARLLFVATWLESDREGRFVWRPKTLKLRYLPGDDCDIEALANELLDTGLIITYDIDGQTFAEIPTFTKHQVINNRESASTIPQRVSDALRTRGLHVTDATPTPLMGKEGKGRESTRTRHVTRDGVDEGFADFWEAYPNKKAKPKAEAAWRKLKPSVQTLSDLLTGLERHKASEQWLRDGGQYIPHPASWINGRRWEDQLPEARAVTTSTTHAEAKPIPGAARTRFGATEIFDECAGWVPA